MKIAIHQPNFCPVKGYFDKIAAVDLFVIMVHCQWEKGKYQNRFFADGRWHTMSVNHGLEPIIWKRYVNPEKDWDVIVSRYPKLGALSPFVSSYLADTNNGIIKSALDSLGIHIRIEFDYPTKLTGTDRLVDICKHYNATEYLSGQSGRKYLDLKKFDEAGIKVSFQDNPDLTPLVHLI